MPKSKRATQPKRVTEADVKAGQRLRIRRVQLGMSQGTVAQRLGVTFQQVQKYENGRNRLSGGRLHQLADILDVPVAYFFEQKQTAGAKDTARDIVAQMLMTRDGSKLCSLWLEMTRPKRNKVLKLVEMMAE